MVVLDRSSLPAAPGRNLQSQGLRLHRSVSARRSRLVGLFIESALAGPSPEPYPHSIQHTQQILKGLLVSSCVCYTPSSSWAVGCVGS